MGHVKQGMVERRSRSHRDIEALVDSRTGTLSLFSKLADQRPFNRNKQVQSILQEFCESLVDYTASAHFQLYRHIDENRERRRPVSDLANEIYPYIADTTQAILDFNDKYDCGDHCSDLAALDRDLSSLGEKLADRIELEDRLISIMSEPITATQTA